MAGSTRRSRAQTNKDFVDFLEKDLQEIMNGGRPLNMPIGLTPKRKAAIYSAEANAYAKLRAAGRVPKYRKGHAEDDPYYIAPVKPGEKQRQIEKLRQETEERFKQATTARREAHEKLQSADERAWQILNAAEEEAKQIRAEAAAYRARITDKEHPEKVSTTPDSSANELNLKRTHHPQALPNGCTLTWQSGGEKGLMAPAELSAFLKTLFEQLKVNGNPKIGVLEIVFLRPNGKKIPVLKLLLPNGDELIGVVGKTCGRIVTASLNTVFENMSKSLRGEATKLPYPKNVGLSLKSDQEFRYGALRVRSGVFVASFAAKYAQDAAAHRTCNLVTIMAALAQLAAARGEMPTPIRTVKNEKLDEVVTIVNADFDELKFIEHERWNAWCFQELPGYYFGRARNPSQ